MQDFHLEGMQKIMRMYTTSAKSKVPYSRGPGSSRVIDALSCYLSLTFKHSDTKWDKKTPIADQILGGGGGTCLLGPLWIRHCQ